MVIVPCRQYEEMEQQKKVAKDHFWAMIRDLRAKTAHLSPEEQQRLSDEMDDAILAEQKKERQQKHTSA
ncbi:MAG: hypothetical protein ACYDBJ_20630 [Aggregatilineales bacterium]